jgi:hypothetical protein
VADNIPYVAYSELADSIYFDSSANFVLTPIQAVLLLTLLLSIDHTNWLDYETSSDDIDALISEITGILLDV